MIEEILESPGFWLLGVGSCIAVLMGWVWSRNSGMESLPFWQLLLILAVCLAVSAFFALKE